MSRALNINASTADVAAACAKLDAPISMIEALPSGATRVVLRNGDAAAIVARFYAKNVLPEGLARTPRAVLGYGAIIPRDEPRATPGMMPVGRRTK